MHTLYCWVLNKEVSSTIFKVFGMTQPGIEPRSPRPLANTQTTRLMSHDARTLSECPVHLQGSMLLIQRCLALDRGTWSQFSSFVWWHIKLRGLFNAKAILLEPQWCYLTHSWEDKGVHTFPKGICPKVNVIARLEFELAGDNSAVQRRNHNTTRTPPWSQLYLKLIHYPLKVCI